MPWNSIPGSGGPRQRSGSSHTTRATSALASGGIREIPEWGKGLENLEAVFQKGDYKAARELLEGALEKAKALKAYGDPRFAFSFAGLHVNLAMLYCHTSRGDVDRASEGRKLGPEAVAEAKKKALEHLRKGIDFGFNNPEMVKKNRDFSPLFELPEFKALMKAWEEKLKKE
ncbi:MAG: TPR end-of-group domain-containing protein [Planctomycetota bacterium]